MVIRRIQQEDNHIIELIIRKVMSEFNTDPTTNILGDPTLPRMHETYLEHGAVYFVVELDGKIVGGCGIRQLDGSIENICELQRMFLLPEARGMGIAKELINLCINKAREYSYDQIYLETLSEMHNAIRLYTNTGFIKIDAALGATGHGGCNVHMILDL